MDRRPSPVIRTVTGLVLVLLGFGSGCKQKIDENRSKLMSTVRISLSSLGTEGDAEVGRCFGKVQSCALRRPVSHGTFFTD